jgi:hypothetical protein
MPKLRGEQIPRAVGRNQERTHVHQNEIMVGCPRINDCGWKSVRPLTAAHSAQVAHMIRHAKGLA